MSKYRSRVPSGQSRRSFSRTAKRVHPKNAQGRPMRGGIRL